jgi:hypothetical protein
VRRASDARTHIKLSLPIVLLASACLIGLSVYIGTALKLPLAVKNLVLVPIALVVIFIIGRRWMDT